ncbi:MAG: GIY-YIG nuclease family protein [Planctomycetota bacterium]
MFWVYVLVSESTGKRYIGQTNALDRRIAEHNSPGHNNPRKHTSRNAGPWVLLHSERFQTRAEAMRREKWLKSGVGRAWLDQALHRASPPDADEPLGCRFESYSGSLSLVVLLRIENFSARSVQQ